MGELVFPDDVVLGDEDVRLAIAVGGARQWSALRSGKRDAHGFKGDSWGVHIEGVAGEIALARFLGWSWWVPTIDTFQTEPDLPLGIEVTTRSRHDWDLIIRPRMALSAIHVLVTGEIPAFRIRGWAASHAARRPEFWQAPGGRAGAWFVPVAALSPMAVLHAAAQHITPKTPGALPLPVRNNLMERS